MLVCAMARITSPCDRPAMAIERKIRSVGHKSVIYPWVRRYVVVGPYNRHVRRDVAASAMTKAIMLAAVQAGKLRSRAANSAAAARSNHTKRSKSGS